MSIKLVSTGGGSVTIQEPNTASDFTLSVPAATGSLVLSGTTPSLNGITFPSAQVSSADANTLDDYEEGTFTVAVRGSGTAGTYTITSQNCTYTKIGRLVSISILINGFSAATGGVGYLQITGMPFINSKTCSGAFQGNFLNFSTGTLFSVVDFVSTGESRIYIRQIKDDSSGEDFPISGISTSTTAIIMSLVYET